MQQQRGGKTVDAEDLEGTAKMMARQLARLFRAHDRGLREEAIEACLRVDRLQFPALESADVELAAERFVDALWAKDEVEFQHLTDGAIDTAGLRQADYGEVRARLRERASLIGADPRYATTKAEAWRRHKVGGDYWTPFVKSQVFELRTILDDPPYPNKPRGGQSGPGPEPLRYILAFELHDMKTERHWQEGIEVMTPYFAKILRVVGQ